MNMLIELIIQSMGKVWITFTHNWPFLLASIIISVGLKLYIQPDKVSAFIARYRRVGIIGATAAAVTTPFCSCGTTAVILGMIASTIPWAPIVAFMVASPLTSPEELVYSAGLFGWPFAIAFFISSILLGLLGGILAEILESRGWLVNQARFNLQTAPVTAVSKSPLHEPVRQPSLALESCCDPSVSIISYQANAAAAVETPSACSCGSGAAAAREKTETAAARQVKDEKTSTAAQAKKVTARQWIEELYQAGKKLLPMFLGFAFIGYLLNGLIPASWVSAVFGGGNAYSVPLAATLGLPLYINSEGSLPLVRALIDNGMSQGAALAFLITGAGTSFGAVAGALTIARWRVISIVVGTLWAGAIVLGYAYDLIVTLHLV